MAGCKVVAGIVRANASKCRGNARVYAGVFLLLVIGFVYLFRIPFFCSENGYTCTPFVIAFLFAGGMLSSGVFKVLFFFVVIMIFSKAPFLDEHAYFMITRTGRKKWMVGEVVYLLAASFVLMILLWMMILAATLPCAEKNIHEWGSLPIRVITDITIRRDYNIMNGWVVDTNLLYHVDPFVSAILVSLLVYLDIVIIGLVIYAGNLYLPKRNLGIGIAAFLVLLDAVITALTGEPTRFLHAFSPITWCSLNQYKAISGWGVLSTGLVLGLALLWILVLLFLIYLKTKRMDIMLYDMDLGG